MVGIISFYLFSMVLLTTRTLPMILMVLYSLIFSAAIYDIKRVILFILQKIILDFFLHYKEQLYLTGNVMNNDSISQFFARSQLDADEITPALTRNYSDPAHMFRADDAWDTCSFLSSLDELDTAIIARTMDVCAASDFAAEDLSV